LVLILLLSLYFCLSVCRDALSVYGVSGFRLDDARSWLWNPWVSFISFYRTSGDITPLVARYSLFDIIHARLGVVRVFLIRNCCRRYG